MADYLILKQTANRWEVVNSISGKTANTDGECAAIVQSFSGPGKYVAFRIDNAKVMEVTVEPKLTEVGRVNEPVEEEPPTGEPAEESVQDEEPSSELVEVPDDEKTP